MEQTTSKPSRASIAEGIVNFVQRNRKSLVIVCSAIVASLVVFSLVVALAESSRLKAIVEVDALSRRYDEIRFLGDETAREASVTALIGELSVFAAKHGSFAGAKAYAVLAGIQADRKEWTEAEASWTAAAAKSPKSFMAPVSLYNAATAAEERGDLGRAIELYTRSAEEYAAVFPLAARAYFAVGRLYEERRDQAAAIAAYKKIVDTWPNDNWTKPANSRILALSLSAE